MLSLSLPSFVELVHIAIMAPRTGSIVEIWRWEEVYYDMCFVDFPSRKGGACFWVKYSDGRREEVDFSQETWRYKARKPANTTKKHDAESACSEDSYEFKSALGGSSSSSGAGEENAYEDSSARGNEGDGNSAGCKKEKHMPICLLV